MLAIRSDPRYQRRPRWHGTRHRGVDAFAEGTRTYDVRVELGICATAWRAGASGRRTGPTENLLSVPARSVRGIPRALTLLWWSRQKPVRIYPTR